MTPIEEGRVSICRKCQEGEEQGDIGDNGCFGKEDGKGL